MKEIQISINGHVIRLLSFVKRKNVDIHISIVDQQQPSLKNGFVYSSKCRIVNFDIDNMEYVAMDVIYIIAS